MGARRVGGGVPAVADSRPKQSGGDNLRSLFRLLSRAQIRAREQNAARCRVYYKDSDLFGRYVAFVFFDDKFMGIDPDLPDFLGKWAIPAIALLGIIAFLLYDYALSKLITFYCLRLSSKLRKILK